MTQDDFKLLINLTHKLRQAVKAGNADLDNFDLNQIPFDQIEDLAFVLQMTNAMIFSK